MSHYFTPYSIDLFPGRRSRVRGTSPNIWAGGYYHECLLQYSRNSKSNITYRDFSSMQHLRYFVIVFFSAGASIGGAYHNVCVGRDVYCIVPQKLSEDTGHMRHAPLFPTLDLSFGSKFAALNGQESHRDS